MPVSGSVAPHPITMAAPELSGAAEFSGQSVPSSTRTFSIDVQVMGIASFSRQMSLWSVSSSYCGCMTFLVTEMTSLQGSSFVVPLNIESL